MVYEGWSGFSSKQVFIETGFHRNGFSHLVNSTTCVGSMKTHPLCAFGENPLGGVSSKMKVGYLKFFNEQALLSTFGENPPLCRFGENPFR